MKHFSPPVSAGLAISAGRVETSAPTELVRIAPTIGRKVWYWPDPHELRTPGNPGGFICFDSEQAFDATVIYAHGMNKVNVRVTDHRGMQFTKNDCALVQEGETPPSDRGYVTWMPYQQQAARKS
jgi:hypothetical protein